MMIALLTAIGLAAAAPAAPATPAAQCPATGPALQVLGSGGPLADDDRAGSGYVLRVDGKPRILIDAGSGVFLRFGQAGVRFTDLELIAISHFHADHVGDLAAVLNSGGFEKRAAPLRIAGPRGNGAFPGVADFLAANFDEQRGAYRYLAGFLDGRYELPVLEPVEVAADPEAAVPVIVHDAGGIRVTAIPVHHGDVPALGYLVETGGKAIVFAGDQSFLSEGFAAALAGRKPDLLVAHHAIPEGPGQPRGLHRPPSSIGELADTLAAKRLILSHNMQRALLRQEEGRAAIAAAYSGPVTMAADLDCFGF